MTSPVRFARRLTAWSLATAVVLAIATGVHPTVAAKPGAPARSCYDCHAGSKKEFAKKNVHDPVAKGDCAACHLSHGFSQKLVLKKPAEELCFDCHADLKKAPAPAHEHAAFKRGECYGCHDSHASNEPHLLREGGPEASCFKCHDKTAQEAKLAVQHAPFKAGECASCHVSRHTA